MLLPNKLIIKMMTYNLLNMFEPYQNDILNSYPNETVVEMHTEQSGCDCWVNTKPLAHKIAYDGLGLRA